MSTDPAAPAYVPRAPATTDAVTVVLPIAVAAVLAVSIVLNAVFGARFPSNAPVESIWNFGISVSLVGGAVALVIRFLIIRLRPRAAAIHSTAPSGMAVTALILGLVTLAGWLWLGGADFLLKLVSGERLRYYLDANGAFFLGLPWMLALFFGIAGFRPGRGRLNNVFALVGIGAAAFILVASLASAVIYGLGLSD